MDTQSIAELFDVSRKWEKLGSGRYTAAYLLKETAGSLSKVFGLSIGNIMRDLSATINTGISIADSFGADTVEPVSYTHLAGDTSAIRYLEISGGKIRFLSAVTDGTQTEQLHDGETLYWYKDANSREIRCV